MKEYLSEILIGVVGVVSASVAWTLGGKQKASNEKTDAITTGTDKIVETSNKLLVRLETLLEQERERYEVERQHRETCETSLREHKHMIEELSKKVAILEGKIKKL